MEEVKEPRESNGQEERQFEKQTPQPTLKLRKEADIIRNQNARSWVMDCIMTEDQQKENSHARSGSQEQHEAETNTLDVFLSDVSYDRIQDASHLFLFGITDDDKRVTIKVSNIQRVLYFVLNPGVQQKEEQDVREQISELLRRQCQILKPSGRFLAMKYIFEIKDVPRGDVKVYEVRYPFQVFEGTSKTLKPSKTPSPDSTGHYFNCVIGTTYTPLEVFLIHNKIKGPQWVKIPQKSLKSDDKAKEMYSCTNISNAQFYNLADPHSVDSQSLSNKSAPSLKVMSISLKQAKPAEKENQKPSDEFKIYSLSYAYWPKYKLQSKQVCAKDYESFSYYCFKGQISESDPKTRYFYDEGSMLSYFLNVMSRLDPDVMVCHDSSKTLDVITSRLIVKGNHQKERLGRIKFEERASSLKEPHIRLASLTRGRIVVDTMKQAEDAIKSNDHKLSTLSQLLRLKPLSDLSSEGIVQMVKQKDELRQVMMHTLDQAQNTLGVLSKLQILEASLKLANICGYLWQKVLDNNRAQRNEYLIMHQCFKQGCIIPDKFFTQEEAQDSKYEGGLVLEPQKGLHHGFTILLDFVSLYPSVIRQYNICFSTVKRNLIPLNHYIRGSKKTYALGSQQEQCKVIPPQGQHCEEENWGLLPRLIDILVSQRQKYKQLMKGATQTQRSIYNTTQIAYKLVANSVYGCLGYEKSRFYARDLAALITELGRGTLKNAQEIVQNWKVGGSECFEVIYGDTDSLMIRVKGESKGNEEQDQEEEGMQSAIRRVVGLTSNLISGENGINSFYKIIKMQLDGIFNPILLISKKKYAGNKLINLPQILDDQPYEQKQDLRIVRPEFQVEYKGVEAIRSDSSGLLKEVNAQLFALLLQPQKSIYEISTEVYEYFLQLSSIIQNHSAKEYGKYVIRKTLTKDPSQYKNQKGMHHLAVAKHLIQQGHRVDSLVNHMIEYVLVQGQKGATPVDVNSYVNSTRGSNELKIDKRYYKQKEVLPVVQRMLEEIKEIDLEIVRENLLGKDYRSKKSQESKEGTYISIVIEVDKKTQVIDDKFHELFGTVDCSKCLKTYRIVRNGLFTSSCQVVSCECNTHSGLLPRVLDKLHKFISEYCSQSEECKRCDRQQIISIDRSNGNGEQQATRQSEGEFHDSLYMIRKTALDTLEKLQHSEGLSSLIKSIDQILSQSPFETIKGALFTRLRFSP